MKAQLTSTADSLAAFEACTPLAGGQTVLARAGCKQDNRQWQVLFGGTAGRYACAHGNPAAPWAGIGWQSRSTGNAAHRVIPSKVQ
jgi:hypothetical protein